MATPDFVLSLRERIGNELLWMPGVTAVVLNPARTRLLVVRRADDGRWTPVTGIVDPGEEPARAAEREVAEEAG
ncbi:MAG: NUDIX domain-containing protein, partial [Brachybacterium sp.]|uniref:NUDIX domain-containing protein n=1 Tax=Brachybacterium sp. TaxID=1891286 RepID=UPI003241E7F3